MKRMKTLSIVITCVLTCIGSANFAFAKDDVSTENVNKMIEGWPARPRLAVQAMMEKYGEPVEVSSETVVWHNEGPYKRIMVTKMEIPHDFPKPHMDFLQHTILYNVPTDKVDDLIAFDASMTVNKTAGEMSARCDLEGHNVLTLNLAKDIITGKKNVAEARKAFAMYVGQDVAGKHPDYVDKLLFEPQSMEKAAFADRPNIPGSPVRSLAEGKSTGDAEVLAFVIAADDNEVLAAAEAQKKDISKEVKDYAKMLQTEHGNNQKMVMMLGEKIKSIPADTTAVDQLRIKGADTLAKLVPLKGEAFEKAYIDAMVKGHQEVITMIDVQLLPVTENDALKKQLMETKKHVSMHLDQAKKIQSKM